MSRRPDGWTRESLSDLVHEVRVSVTPQAGKGYQLWSVPSFADRRPERVDGSEIGSAKRRVQPRDVLLCKINPRINRVWIVGQEPEGCEQIASPEWLVLRTPDLGPRVIPEFLRLYLASPAFRDWIVMAVSGVTGSHTRAKAGPILQQTIPVPPLDEQRRIVDILEDHLSRLDAVDASFVSVRAKVIALRDAISASALFADLAGEAGHRSRVSVGDVADVDSGPAFKSSLFGGPGAGTRLLRGDNIEPGSLRWGRTKSWPDSQLGGFEHLLVAERDIILAMDRPVVSAGLKLARVTESDIPALLVQRVARIRPRDTVVGDFLYQILSSRQFVHQLLGNQVGTQIPHITLEAIRKFAFLLPEPAVQIAVARQVRAHFESTERVEHDITLASTRSRSLRRSLLAAAFSGRLTGRSNDMEMVEEMAGV